MMKSHCGLLAGLLFASLAWADQPVDRHAAADARGAVEISNVSGSVSIAGWERNEVQVTGTLGEAVERLEFSSDAQRTVIKVVHKNRRSWGSDGDAELEIRVPAGSRLNVSTVSAEIDVGGVEGAQRLQSVSGDITGELGKEEAEIKTVSGEVLLRGTGVPTILTLTTVSGDAQVTRVAGEVVANTVSGNLKLSLDKLARVRARSTSGDLDLSGGLAAGARMDVETISGELSLTFKGSLDAEFDLESFSGDIENCFGPKASPKSEHGPGRELHFRQGNGSGRVRVNSLSGDIHLCTA